MTTVSFIGGPLHGLFGDVEDSWVEARRELVVPMGESRTRLQISPNEYGPEKITQLEWLYLFLDCNCDPPVYQCMGRN